MGGKRLVMPAVMLSLTAWGLLGCGQEPQQQWTPTYPEARRGELVEDHHGTPVADPYRWLEDADTAETRTWIEAENELTRDFLEGVPERDAVRQRLTELWSFERYTLPREQGGLYFYGRNDGLQDQDVVYVAEGLDDEGRILLDPNTLSEDGTVSLTGFSVSEDGRYAAYGTSSGGSDWQEWRVREVATAEDLTDVVSWVKFSSAEWSHDGDGFYYSRYDEPAAGQALEEANYNQRVYFHRLGTPQSEDELVYARPDQEKWGFGADVTDDGRYLTLRVWEGSSSENAFFYLPLAEEAGTGAGGGGGSEMVELLPEFDARYAFVGNDGPVFWFWTDLDAPRGRLVAVDTRSPEPTAWRELISEGEDTLRRVSVIGDRFVAQYLKDARSVVRLHHLDGRPDRELDLPAIGSVRGFGGERDDRETFYQLTSFTTPGTIYRYDFDTGESTVYRSPDVGFDADAFETRQVFYDSTDGTRVPMFITHKKGLTMDGSHPAHLYGYGGFGITITPSFSITNLVWMEMGGVYAVANLRGGGEYGEEWHQAATGVRKQTTFDDFLAAAEFLVAEGYTSADRLAISGGSNGGLLVGAAMTQRPDLFGAVIARVGVMDMLRFHKFTIGWAWVSDYGTPEDPEEFQALYAYSPYHNVRQGTAYPATLVTTADHDDRVVPGHSFKFAAALQHAQGGPEPVLIRIETRAGHGAGTPVSKRIDQATDELAFLVAALDMQPGTEAPWYG